MHCRPPALTLLVDLDLDYEFSIFQCVSNVWSKTYPDLSDHVPRDELQNPWPEWIGGGAPPVPPPTAHYQGLAKNPILLCLHFFLIYESDSKPNRILRDASEGGFNGWGWFGRSLWVRSGNTPGHAHVLFSFIPSSNPFLLVVNPWRAFWADAVPSKGPQPPSSLQKLQRSKDNCATLRTLHRRPAHIF